MPVLFKWLRATLEVPNTPLHRCMIRVVSSFEAFEHITRIVPINFPRILQFKVLKKYNKVYTYLTLL